MSRALDNHVEENKTIATKCLAFNPKNKNVSATAERMLAGLWSRGGDSHMKQTGTLVGNF